NLSTSMGDVVNANPMLGPLRDNGGVNHVPTRALLPGSPALDAGNTAAAPSTDERGVSRPQNGIADIGAVEDQLFTFIFSNVAQATTVGTPFANPLQFRILEGTNPIEGAQVQFALVPVTASATFSGGSASAAATTDANGV